MYPFATLAAGGFTGTANGNAITIPQAIPMGIQPQVDFTFPVLITDDGSVSWGTLYLKADNSGITIHPGASTTATFTTGHVITVGAVMVSWCCREFL
jgi:hypothetical protein